MSRDRKKVSIIVPVYMVEKYLQRCLDSIAAQTYQNIEVILVDDGSPDSSGEICESFAKTNTYTRVIHQENQGQSVARNVAMQVATGEYIAFIDSDDYVEKDCIEYLVDLLEKYHADVSIGGFKYTYEGKNPKARAEESREIKMTAEEALIRMNYSMGFGATPWAKLYKRQLILDHPFPEGQIYEDLAVLYKIIGDCKTVVYGSKRIYYWVQREGSTMRTAFDARQLAGIEAAEAQLKYIEANYPKAIQAAKARYMGKTAEIMALALRSSDAKTIYKELKQKMIYFKDVMADNRVKKTLKLRLLSAKIGYIPAKLVFRLHEKAKTRKY